MPNQNAQENVENFEQFRDAFSAVLIEKTSAKHERAKSRKKQKVIGERGPNTFPSASRNTVSDTSPRDAEDLAEFTDYIALLTFESLPLELQNMSHQIWAQDSPLQDKYSLPLTSNDVSEHIVHMLDPEVSESLSTYGITSPPAEDMTTFLAPVLTSYLTAMTTPPPAAWTTRGKVNECELCERDWVPLTYHHLIPRLVHAKAIKRGWHRKEDLQNVAWLCRACHSFVHRFAGHEELAREYYTVDMLLEQEQIRSFAAWVSRVRWKAR